MSWARRLLRGARAGERILRLVALFATIICGILLAADFRSSVLDSVRAYVSGEALWSKAQKEAVYHLNRYAETQSPTDFSIYERAIDVTLGDRQARLELEKPEPDLEVARQGFLRGNNHPDDVDGMISMFRRFRHVSFMQDAIALWTEGDRLIDELRRMADELRAAIASGTPDETRVRAIVAEIALIDGQLRPLEDGFSKTLGEGARWARAWLNTALYLATALLLLNAVWLSRRMLRAERRERESAALTQSIVDEALDCIITADPNGMILDFNPAAERTFGWQREEVVGRTIADTIVPLSLRAAHIAGLRRHRDSGKSKPSARMELTAMRKNGKEFPVELTVTTIERPEGPILAAHVRDLSERRQAEQGMREAEARRMAEEELLVQKRFFEQVADATPHIFFLIDLQTQRVVYVNRQLEKVLGYSGETDDLSFAFVQTRLHPEDTLPLANAFRSWLRRDNRNAVVEVDLRIRHRDGGWRCIHCRTTVFARDHEGRPTQVLGTAEDVTERKRGEELARQQEAALAHVQRVATLAEMATSLAHELNQPLAAIVSFARGCSLRLRSGRASPKDLLPVIEQISTQALRAGDFIRHTRELATKRMPTRGPVDVNEIVASLQRLLEAEAQRIGVAIELDLTAEAPTVMGDRIQIEQVVLNLIRNGLDAMRDGSPPPRTILIRTGPVEDRMVISVCDAGPGIPPAVEPYLFEPFFSTKGDGMGMGLAISRSIVEAHGGRISATANSTRGTTFTVELPLSGSEAAQSPEPAPLDS